jgi:regulator of protease activity HflC (stomatin/prohibitin superfamily)
MAKYLIKTTEEHRADNEREAAELIEAAKKDGRYALAKYSSVHKERKQKGEIIDEYYLVTLVKVFDDAKEPCGEASVEYKIGAF